MPCFGLVNPTFSYNVKQGFSTSAREGTPPSQKSTHAQYTTGSKKVPRRRCRCRIVRSVIHEESTVSSSGSGGPPLDKPVTVDEVEYLITELEESQKKAKILEENSYFFHHWKIFEFLFLKDTIAAKAVFDA